MDKDVETSKQKITRKDGIVYERKTNPNKYVKNICLRVDENTYNKLKELDNNPSKVIRVLINEYFERLNSIEEYKNMFGGEDNEENDELEE